MTSNVHIPEKVLAWRERLRKGSIMKSRTFSTIKRKAASRYKKRGVGKKVAGKAYQVTLLRRYLDTHPGDKTVMEALKKLVERKRGRAVKGNPHLKWYIGIGKMTGRRVIFKSSQTPTRRKYSHYRSVIGPFNTAEEVHRYRLS